MLEITRLWKACPNSKEELPEAELCIPRADVPYSDQVPQADPSFSYHYLSDKGQLAVALYRDSVFRIFVISKDEFTQTQCDIGELQSGFSKLFNIKPSLQTLARKIGVTYEKASYLHARPIRKLT